MWLIGKTEIYQNLTKQIQKKKKWVRQVFTLLLLLFNMLIEKNNFNIEEIRLAYKLLII